MNNQTLYVNIRIPKSGSSTLQKTVEMALPKARLFDMVGPVYAVNTNSIVDRFRAKRKLARRLYKNYKTIDIHQAWKNIQMQAKSGDIVSGHFSIEDIELDQFTPQLISLVRNPVYRLLSEYNYNRNGYNKRNFVQKLYHHNRISAAGRYSFAGFIDYLIDQNISLNDICYHYLLGNYSGADVAGEISRRYFCIDVLEKPKRFLSCLEQKLGNKVNMPNENITAKKHKINLSDSEFKKAENYCEKDMNLYETISHLS